MSFSDHAGNLPLHVMREAARLFFEIRDGLHVISADGDGVLFTLIASPQLADHLAAFGCDAEDAEDDGTAEPDARELPSMLPELLTPAPRQGQPVSAWSPSTAPFETNAGLSTHDQATPPDVAGFWPDLVRR